MKLFRNWSRNKLDSEKLQYFIKNMNLKNIAQHIDTVELIGVVRYYRFAFFTRAERCVTKIG